MSTPSALHKDILSFPTKNKNKINGTTQIRMSIDTTYMCVVY